MRDWDHVAAIVLCVLAALGLVAGIVHDLRSRRQIQAPTQLRVEDSDWTDADRYHGSRQWGR